MEIAVGATACVGYLEVVRFSEGPLIEVLQYIYIYIHIYIYIYFFFFHGTDILIRKKFGRLKIQLAI